MKIVVYGLGYVGLTTAACLADQGHAVLGVDTNVSKAAQVNAGRSPINEPGIEALIAEAVRAGRLEARQDDAGALADADVAIVCVGTPSMPDGSLNLGAIAEVSRQIARRVDARRTAPLTVVYRSTIRPGVMEQLIRPIFQSVLGEDSAAVELVYNPEFLRESVAIHDFLAPPKVVVGTADGRPSKNLEALNAGIDAPTFVAHYREAEITKFVDNSFHALKVAFANEIGRICSELDIDPQLVHDIFVSDTKLNISARYLRPGGPFGGSCLPKDVRALQHLAADIGANTHVIDALLRSNDAHKQFLFQRCVSGLAPGSNVLMLGLAFKADSDDLRESPKMDLARKILQADHTLDVYDPGLDPGKLVGQNLGYAYANLPELRELLVDRRTVETSVYDRIIDTSGLRGSLRLRGATFIDASALRGRGRRRRVEGPVRAVAAG
jgi:GDP-mannose 6-dehydrogenase